MERTLATYFTIAKPGIIFGNALTAAAGLSAAGSLRLLVPTVLGLSAIVTAGCIFNNIYDRAHDAKMTRTHARPLAQGLIDPRSAALIASSCVLLGTLMLSYYTTLLTASLALLGLVLYLAVYTPLKYRTPHATLVGALAGALPPVIGYTAERPLDSYAFLLFALLALWQMPHFYAIALRRADEYTAAAIPVFPLVYGIRATQAHMLLYLFAFTALAAWLSPFSLLCTLPWLFLSAKRPSHGTSRWASHLFFLSLVAIAGISGLLLMGLG